MKINPIRTRADHRAALKEIESLMSARPGTPEGERLDVLVEPAHRLTVRGHGGSCPGRRAAGQTRAARPWQSIRSARYGRASISLRACVFFGDECLAD